ncbi:MAG: bifunctional precorrin-2 dehydrogenase/sirohydrochlorin ferrochelatase, partial [Anaerolineae bacterium]|nr:bifunctional precorrin-2 dehydrogenase/sirohydrochlorin ferrochelatase [Anaerolineae bacterium]
PFLVIAATNQPDVNRQVYEEARALNSLINVVDAPELSDFYSMATMRRGPLTMSIASGGAAPALTAHLRQQMESSIGPEYETLAVWMAELRPEVRAHLASKTARAALWQRVIASPVLTYLHEGNFNQARAVLESLVQEAFES